MTLNNPFDIMGLQATTAGLDWPAQRRFFGMKVLRKPNGIGAEAVE